MPQILFGVAIGLLFVAIALAASQRDDGVSVVVSLKCYFQAYDDRCYVDRNGVMRAPK